MAKKGAEVNVSRLIEAVQGEELIYSVRHPYHKNRKTVFLAWKRIAEQLNSEPTVCREEWIKTRRNYLNYKKKETECTRSGAGSSSQRAGYLYAHSMQFLDDHIEKNKNTYSNATFVEEPSSDSESEHRVEQVNLVEQESDAGENDFSNLSIGSLPEDEEIEAKTPKRPRNDTVQAEPKRLARDVICDTSSRKNKTSEDKSLFDTLNLTAKSIAKAVADEDPVISGYCMLVGGLLKRLTPNLQSAWIARSINDLHNVIERNADSGDE